LAVLVVEERTRIISTMTTTTTTTTTKTGRQKTMFARHGWPEENPTPNDLPPERNSKV
jgi:hypothetical protein